MQFYDGKRQRKLNGEADKLEYAIKAYLEKCSKKDVVPDEAAFRKTYMKKRCSMLTDIETAAAAESGDGSEI